MCVAELLARVVDRALDQVRQERLPVFTFAFYHDHESHAVSVCVDTAENSAETVRSTNDFSSKFFQAAVEEGDLATAGLWQANVGRSLSLGDFAMVNVARTDLDDEVEPDAEFYLAMVRTLVARQARVAQLAPDLSSLAFACSGADAEVSLVWSVPSGA